MAQLTTALKAKEEPQKKTSTKAVELFTAQMEKDKKDSFFSQTEFQELKKQHAQSKDLLAETEENFIQFKTQAAMRIKQKNERLGELEGEQTELVRKNKLLLNEIRRLKAEKENMGVDHFVSKIKRSSIVSSINKKLSS